MIVVNSSTRQFNIPGADLVFGVESDSGSVIKEFQCPRYVGNNLDLTGCFIRMNYRNANGEIDSYLVKNVTVDGDNVVFGWELAPKVTMYKGNVSFVMCVVGPDTKVKWHTTLGRGQVLEGLEPDEALIEEGTVDVVAQLVAMVEAQTEAVENKGAEWVRNVQSEGTDQIIAVQTAARESREAAVAQIEAKGVNVRESIPDDYTALSEAVDGLVRSRAGAIVCEAAGSAITVNDASDLPMQGMKIFGRSTQDGTPTPDAPVEIVSVDKPVVTVAGKNLVDISKIYRSSANATFEKTDTTVRLVDTSGTNSYPAMYTKVILIPNTTYTASCDVTVASGMAWLGFNISNDEGATYPNTNTWSSEKRTESGHITITFTTTDSGYIRMKLFGENGNTSGCDVTYYNIQLERNNTETAYEPYSGQTVELTHTLPGIPVTSGGNYTDSDGQQWICDEVDLERGVYVQRIKTDTVTISSRGMLDNGLSAGICKAPDKLRLLAAGAICDRAKFVGISGSAKNPNCFYENLNNFGFTGAETDTLEMLQAAYDGATITYILATPIETALSETEIAAYRVLHSNYPNTTVLNDAGAHMVVRYAADTKLYIDNKIAALIGG